MVTVTGILPRELVELIIQFYNRDDSDAAVLRAVSKTFCDLAPPPEDGHKKYMLKISNFISSIPHIQWAKPQMDSYWDRKMRGCRPGIIEEMIERKDAREANLCGLVAREGNLEVLKWLKQEGCNWDAWTCTFAVQGGHFELLKWLRSQGCPWDKWTCAWAAQGGRLEILKWLRQNGCPWDRWTYWWAAKHEHIELLEWAIDNGCPG